MEMRRGDLIIAVLPGDYDKPRPVLVIQGDDFIAIPSVTVLPLSSDLQPASLFRIPLDPTEENGLERRSQIMVDKAATVIRAKVGRHIGRVDDVTRRAVDRALVNFLELG